MADYTCNDVSATGDWTDSIDQCVLTYDDRFLRRKVIKTQTGASVLIDLAQTTSLNHGDGLRVQDGKYIAIEAAAEPLLAITGENLVQLAWHVGNRHTPCQIEPNRLLIQRDKVIGHMLEHLGAVVTQVVEPFTPEGGAYGHGRTHSHEHGHTAHDH
ncbi:urease accessory protein UreE [Loktanella sp. F6476L]|uniref:urease accessory protein UreE n=1 Tax=Loktanella sp. F6476L TaxID=2926405 RepID=UPI001FF1D2F9|nr:urease accessory protein UreE [Loktanella sp. F6476L]MCK0119561.1 urease accessory protein UreE [Loktanella sp. F6476L]